MAGVCLVLLLSPFSILLGLRVVLMLVLVVLEVLMLVVVLLL